MAPVDEVTCFIRGSSFWRGLWVSQMTSHTGSGSEGTELHCVGSMSDMKCSVDTKHAEVFTGMVSRQMPESVEIVLPWFCALC